MVHWRLHWQQSQTSGHKVLVLIKVKDAELKVDIKSTNDGLSKSLSTDVKRVVL